MTVDDLARDLKVKNEDLLKELVVMGYEVDGPESSLVTDDPTALRAHLVSALPQREVVEKRIRPTVIRRRAKNAPPLDFHEEALSSEESATSDVDVTYEHVPKNQEPAKSSISAGTPDAKKTQRKMKRHEPARIIEMAPPKPSITLSTTTEETLDHFEQPSVSVASEEVGVVSTAVHES